MILYKKYNCKVCGEEIDIDATSTTLLFTCGCGESENEDAIPDAIEEALIMVGLL